MVFQVALAGMTAVFFQIPFVESHGSVEMISDYAKVVNQATDLNFSTTTEFPSKNSTDPSIEYDDFDDLQEENRSLGQNPSSDTMMKYFKGVISLLALLYRFNGKFDTTKPQNLHFKNPNEPRKVEPTRSEVTGKRFHEAQDRFEFPQKKFRYHGNGETNMIDQQFQPLENYPPYNPLEANSAETYNQDDKKTSYDSDLMTYDSSKNEYDSNNVEIQQSYSYEIPYESPKPVKPSYNDWKNHIQPVYQPWKSKPSQENEASTGEDSIQSWQMKNPTDAEPPTYWKSKIPGDEPIDTDTEMRQPWKTKYPMKDFPVYHHPEPPEPDHHFEYHEELPADEDRVSKKPYSYYFLGRKLWYVPLLFSVYFIIYVGALVLKSVARHKIQFPDKIWNLHEDHFDHNKHRRQHRRIDEITENYEKAMEKSYNKFM